jgi:hypothetical protein
MRPALRRRLRVLGAYGRAGKKKIGSRRVESYILHGRRVGCGEGDETIMLVRMTQLATLAVLTLSLFGVTPSASAAAAAPPPTPPMSWKVTCTASASAKVDGRTDFVEYVWCEKTMLSGEQIAQLGFVTATLNVTVDASGNFVVNSTMTSNNYGTVAYSATVSQTKLTGTMNWTIGSTTYTYTLDGVPFTPDPNPQS